MPGHRIPHDDIGPARVASWSTFLSMTVQTDRVSKRPAEKELSSPSIFAAADEKIHHLGGRLGETTSRYRLMNLPNTARHNDGLSPFSSPLIILRVGGRRSPSREKKPIDFAVHKSFLVQASHFFSAALSTRATHDCGSGPSSDYGFLESQTKIIKLPEDRPEDVHLFLRWLYTGSCSGIFAQHTEEGGQVNTVHAPTVCNVPIPRSTLQDASTLVALNQRTAYRHERRQVRPSSPANEQSKGPVNAADDNDNDDDSQPVPPLTRPEPPAFGPLIRLFLFADKYQIGLGLDDLVHDMVAELAGQSNAVPRCEDVMMLYEGLGICNSFPEDVDVDVWTRGDNSGRAEGGGTTAKKRAKRARMIRLTVDLYIGMKNTHKLLRDHTGAGWHLGFLGDLIRETKRRHSSERSSSSSSSGGCGGGQHGRVEDQYARLITAAECAVMWAECVVEAVRVSGMDSKEVSTKIQKHRMDTKR